jgi:hypothetical protein
MKFTTLGLGLLAASCALQAGIVGIGAFTGTAVTEGFENVTNTTNSPQTDGYFAIGAVSTYTFASGLQLTSPIPNPELPTGGGGGPLVGNFADGNATFGTNDGSGVTAALFGNAYFGEDGGATTWTFTLPSPVDLIGGYFAGGAFSISVFNSSNTLLETESFPDVSVANWANGFVGLEDAGISSVTITGPLVVLDNFMFDASTPTPEPGTIMMMGAGLIGLAYWKRRSA